MTDYGFTKEEVEYIIANIEEHYRNRYIILTHFNENTSILEDYGFKKRDIIKMIKVATTMICISKARLIERLKYLEDLGFSQAEVILVTRRAARIITSSRTNIKSKVELFLSIGFDIVTIRKCVLDAKLC